MKADYRIKNSNGTYLNAGTGLNSWFNLSIARELVNYSKGQKIVDKWDIEIL